MSTTIRFGTFNIGQGYADYSMMVYGDKTDMVENGKLQAEAAVIRNQIQEDWAEENYHGSDALADGLAQLDLIRKVELAAADKLVQTCDVIALQEVVQLDRPFIKRLQTRGFSIHHYETTENFSTAIAVRNNFFQDIQNISIKSKSRQVDQKESKNNFDEHLPIYGREISAVRATLKNSEIVVAFGSMHNWGFQLYLPGSDKGDWSYNKNDIAQQGYGDTYASEAAENLSNYPLAIMGGDMNNNPQNRSETFKKIEQEGFKTLEPDQPTNFLDDVNRYNLRKLDFIFVKSSTFFKNVWRVISSVFTSTISLKSTPARVLEGFDFVFEGNCSDHKPVVSTITITKHRSFFGWIFDFICCR